MISLVDSINEQKPRIPSMEYVLGKGDMMPFNNANSGSRKIMQSTQIEHAMQLLHPEPALIQTGYENRFGEYSSYLNIANTDYKVLAKVDKFGYTPNIHYYLIVQNLTTGEYDIIERISYSYITEHYGVLYDNTYLDNLKPGDNISQDDTFKKTLSYDEYNNRQDGRNLITAYIACEHTKEDAIIVSDVAAQKMAVPLIKPMSIIINTNDIPLNIYGDDNVYKAFPDIGEESKGIVTALRRKNKNEALFTQSYYRLGQVMMSDDKYMAKGKVIDINVYCNDPGTFDNFYNAQIKYYYDEEQEFAKNIVGVLEPIIHTCKCTYDLQKLYANCKKVVDKVPYMKDGKVFSNAIVELVLMETSPIHVGDKISNRYGGKGCVSLILPQRLMPQLDNGDYVDVILNPSGCVNRENEGQLIETSANHMSSRVLDFMKSDALDLEQSIKLYLDYLDLINPIQAREMQNVVSHLDEEGMLELEDDILTNGIILSLDPISQSLDIDKLNYIYQHMPFDITPYKIKIPMKDSNGKIRYINARRNIVVAQQYFYRLKQYAEEKMSATSLSSTNIRNENSRNQSKKYYKAVHAKTPIKFGDMETGNLSHVGMMNVVQNLLIVCSSPHARRLTEKLLIDNPFDINVEIDENCNNRGAEVLSIYLFVMGVQLQFTKKRKNLIKPAIFRETESQLLKTAAMFYSPEQQIDTERIKRRIMELAGKKLIQPAKFYPATFRKDR